MRMHEHIPAQRPDAQRLVTIQQPADGVLCVLVRNQHDDVLHPSTPLAKNVPKSVSPRHLRK